MAKNELVSLALLSVNPMHAYAINQVLDDMKLEYWAHISRASIYAALKRLEKQGAVIVTFEKPDNMPERKVFILTNQGKEQLREELLIALSTSTPDDILFNLGMNLCFGLSSEEAIKAAQKRITSLQECLSGMNAAFDLEESKEHDYIPGRISINAAARQLQIFIDMTNEFIAFLQEQPDYYEKVVEEYRAQLQKGE